MKHIFSLTLIVCALGIVGCADPTSELLEMPNSATKRSKSEYTPSAAAGIQKDMSKSYDPARLKGLIAATSRFGSRPNPFALSQDELSFDKLQASERFLAEDGSFGTKFELPEDKGPVTISLEQQPYRRLSGVVIGDAVYGILEENGVSQIIRPGMRLPNSNWRVASIDRDKAVLVRDGNVLPKEIEIRLESAPPGFGQAAGGDGDGGGGRDGAPSFSGSSGAGG